MAELSEIDKALQAAKARKAMRTGNSTEAAATAAPKAPRAPKQSDSEKEAQRTAKEAERAEAKTQRDLARAEKRAARQASKGPAHLKKVLRAGEKLNTLEGAAALLFAEATASLPAAELTSLAAHINHFNREKATQRALNAKLTVGLNVRVVAGDPKFIGKTGTVTKTQRIRCYVTLEGQAKPTYFYTSDVEVVDAASATAALTG